MASERSRGLCIGDRVRVGGGYDMDPKWLAGNPGADEGEVVGFIPILDHEPFAVVALDEELVLPNGVGPSTGPVRGSFLRLHLGHVGTDWSTPSPRIHVFLFERRPDEESSEPGVWVESHASYAIIRDRRQPQPPPLPPIDGPTRWP